MSTPDPTLPADRSTEAAARAEEVVRRAFIDAPSINITLHALNEHARKIVAALAAEGLLAPPPAAGNAREHLLGLIDEWWGPTGGPTTGDLTDILIANRYQHVPEGCVVVPVGEVWRDKSGQAFELEKPPFRRRTSPGGSYEWVAYLRPVVDDTTEEPAACEECGEHHEGYNGCPAEEVERDG